MLSWQWLASFWSHEQVAANLVIFLNLSGALLLGLIVGYERSYHGRAAGMRTYGIVCMASAALTVFVGYPSFWFGGFNGAHAMAADPTRVVQGIVTGVGFLGAGVIMKEGLNISGLTTAASIWASSAIGVLVGVGFYGAAILLTMLSATLMVWGSRLEARLPSRHAISLSMTFTPGHNPSEASITDWLFDCGYELARDSISIHRERAGVEWHFVAVALDRKKGWTLPALSAHAENFKEVESLRLSHARN